MANNALIRGAAEASKKFLDIGGAVAAGINATPDYVPSKNNRVAENKAIQAKVNNYMSKMKTDMKLSSKPKIQASRTPRNERSGKF